MTDETHLRTNGAEGGIGLKSMLAFAGFDEFLCRPESIIAYMHK